MITRLTLGGSARNTIDSAAAAARAGYRTILVTGPSVDEIDLSHLAEQHGCELRVIPSLRRNISPFRELRALTETVRLLRKERVDIIHTHTSKAGMIGRVAARLTGVPVIVHTPHGHIFYAYYGWLRTALFIALERLAARLSDRIVALTDDGISEHLARGIGRRSQYVAIPSGVDLERLRERAPGRVVARAQLGWSPTMPIILGVGRLVPVKGFDLAVKALPIVLDALPDVRLVLVGDGPEKPALQALAARLGVAERLNITGAMEDVTSFLSAADLLVAPSRNEGMGRSIVEAMALGIPVVAARVGGTPSVISDGESGALVTPDDPAALAESITTVLNKTSLRASYRRAGLARAERFSLTVMERELLSLYRTLVVEKGLAAGPEGVDAFGRLG